MLEYVGLTTVAMVVIGGIVLASGGYRVLPPRMEAAICRVIGGGCAVAPGPPPGVPRVNTCTVESNATETIHRTKVVLWSDEDRTQINVSETPTGRLVITSGHVDDDGFDVQIGVGAQIGGAGFGVTAGRDYTWTGEDQERLEFKSPEQHVRYTARVLSELFEAMDDGVDEEQIQDIHQEIAADMGIPYSRLHAEGNSSGSDSELFVGSDERRGGIDGLEIGGGLGTEYGHSELVGTGEHYDAHGNPTTSDYLVVNDEFARDIGVGIDIQGVGPEASIGASEESQSVLEVKYDANGDPSELVISQTSEYEVEGAQGIGLSIDTGGRGSGGETEGFYGNEVSDGDVTVSTTTVPLTPDDAELVEAYLGEDPEDAVEAALDMTELSEREGAVTTVQKYDSESDSEGVNVSGTVVLELGAYEDTTATQAMQLEEAKYVSPRTGELVPWAKCDGGD